MPGLNQWAEYVEQAINKLKKEKINLADNQQTVNALYPIWEKFILEEARIQTGIKEQFKALKDADSRVKLILANLPHLSLLAFWTEVMAKIL